MLVITSSRTDFYNKLVYFRWYRCTNSA